MDSSLVAEALLAVQRKMRQRVDTAMASAGLSLARSKMLSLLEAQGSLTPAQIAVQIGQAPRTVITTLTALIDTGMIRKMVNPDDGRSYLVTITPEGSAALAKAMGPKLDAIDCLFGVLSDTQRRQLHALLTLVETSDG